MVARCVADECALSVSADRLWRVTVSSDAKTLPSVCPELIAAVEIEGDGGPGTIRTMKFTPALEEVTVMKSRVLELDGAARIFKAESLEAGKIRDKLKSQVTEVKLEATGASSCVAKIKVEYEKLDGQTLSQEEEKKICQGWFGLLNKVEAYLVANPGAYA